VKGRKLKPRRNAWVASLALAVGAAACSEDPAAPEVALVQIDPDSIELEIGQPWTLTATAFDESGKKMEAVAAAWSSSDPAVATIGESGEVVGVAEGDAIVTAKVGDMSGRADVKVVPAAVTRVEIEPGSPSVLPDDTLQLAATAFSAWGMLPAGREVSWSSADPDLASVSASGLVRGRAPGLAALTATIEGVVGSVVVEVIPHVGVVRVEPSNLVLLEGESGPLEAVVLGTNGATLTDREVEWSSSVVDVATVDERGVVRALRPGKATIYAEVEGVQNLATVEVKALPASLRIEPPSLLMQTDVTLGLGAIVTDTLGDERQGVGCVWSSPAPSVIDVFADGSLRARSPGKTRIEARCEGKQASIEAEVLPRAELEIRGPSKWIVGEPVQLELRAEDRAPRGPVSWSAAPDALPIGELTVGDDGAAEALTSGIHWVFASAEGRSAARGFVAVWRFDRLLAGPYLTCGHPRGGEGYFCWGNTRMANSPMSPSFPTARTGPTPYPRLVDEGRVPSLGETLHYTTKDDLVRSGGCKADCLDEWGSDFRLELDLVDAPVFETISAGYSIHRPLPFGGASYGAGPACGLTEAGAIHCWRIGESAAPFAPAAFVPREGTFEAATGQTFRALGVGAAFVCALTPEDEAWCWGPGGIHDDLLHFEAGAGAPLPSPLAGAPAFTSISVGKYHACGLTEAGAAWCWGHSREGALGAGDLGSSESPVPVAGGHSFVGISASIEHTCGLTVDEAIYCWGRGEPSPVAVPLDGAFLQVVTGADHACALRTDGVTFCWGDNSLSQLGVLEGSSYLSPRAIHPENLSEAGE